MKKRLALFFIITLFNEFPVFADIIVKNYIPQGEKSIAIIPFTIILIVIIIFIAISVKREIKENNANKQD